jgi:hypothetical protein
MLYEKLNPDMKKTVNLYAQRLAGLDWGRRSDQLAEAAPAFGEELDSRQASLATRGFITAVLERWDEAAVDDPRQAALYLVSLNPDHRALAEVYLAGNPEMRRAIEGPAEPYDA